MRSPGKILGAARYFYPKNGYHGPHLQVTRGTTQGGLISPTLFNLIVDNVVRNWLALAVEDELVTHKGLELEVVRCLGLFYANSGMVGSQYTEWTQGALNVLACLFRQRRLVANVSKSMAMTFHPGEIRNGMSEEVVGRQCTGRGETYR